MATSDLVDSAEFDKILAMYQEQDENRELLIKASRSGLKLSKQAIFALHRKDVSKASKNISECLELIKESMIPTVEKFTALRFTGIFTACLEELAEACIFKHFLETGKLLPISSLPLLRVEEFLGGLMDCTGEINRYAVVRATANDEAAVKCSANFVSAVFEKMLLMDLNNSPLRRKYDTLKYTQKKLDALIYELTLSKRLAGIKPPSILMEDEPRTSDISKNEDGTAEGPCMNYS